MIFASRHRKGQDPHLDWRVRLLFAGGAMGVVGIALGSRILVWVAIGILAVGMGLKFLGRRGDEDEAPVSPFMDTEADEMEHPEPHEP